MSTLRKIIGYTLLVGPFLLLALVARDGYVGTLIAVYAVVAALLTLE